MTALEAPLTGRLPEPRWRTAFGSVEICGKYAAVAMRARERAWSKRSRAAASDWFACSSCSSYWLSVSSPNICHQAPLGIVSFGAACCQGGCVFHASGAAAGAAGRLYRGPTVQAGATTSSDKVKQTTLCFIADFLFAARPAAVAEHLLSVGHLAAVPAGQVVRKQY